MKGKLLHMVSNIQRPAMNKLKTFFFFERKYLIMKSTSTISTNYSQDKNTHFLLFLFLNWNFYFLFVVTLIVVTLRSHFYYTAVR